MGFKSKKSIKDTEAAAAAAFLAAVESAGPDGKWQKSWMGTGDFPVNPTTGREYAGGFNSFVLGLRSLSYGGDNRWAGFGQWKTDGRPVKEDEKGTDIWYPRFKCATCGVPVGWGKKCRNGHSVVKSASKVFSGWGSSVVFNTQQTTRPMETVSPNADVDPEVGYKATAEIIKNLGVNIGHGGGRAYYSPSEDRVQMPVPGAFVTLADYWSTTLHETGHWTGHSTRLDRPGVNGSARTADGYAYEELVAELTAGFLCMHLNIAREGLFENHVQYIATWRRRLTEDPGLLRKAAGEAGAAMRYILKNGGHSTK